MTMRYLLPDRGTKIKTVDGMTVKFIDKKGNYCRVIMENGMIRAFHISRLKIKTTEDVRAENDSL